MCAGDMVAIGYRYPPKVNLTYGALAKKSTPKLDLVRDARGCAQNSGGFCYVGIEKANLQYTEAEGPDGYFRQLVFWNLREGKH